MIFTSLTVTLKWGAYSISALCYKIIIGQQIIGDIDEELDFDLSENYDNRRQTITLYMHRVGFQAIKYIEDFLYSTGKSIVIDTEEVTVVNDKSNLDIDFELWENSNYAAEIKLKFLKKTAGLLSKSS